MADPETLKCIPEDEELVSDTASVAADFDNESVAPDVDDIASLIGSDAGAAGSDAGAGGSDAGASSLILSEAPPSKRSSRVDGSAMDDSMGDATCGTSEMSLDLVSEMSEENAEALSTLQDILFEDPTSDAAREARSQLLALDTSALLDKPLLKRHVWRKDSRREGGGYWLDLATGGKRIRNHQTKRKISMELGHTKRIKWTAMQDALRPRAPIKPFNRYYAYTCRQNGPGNTLTPKVAAENWKVMTHEEKKPFVDPYMEDKAQFEADMQVYKGCGREHIWQSGGITSAKKPFLIFLDDLKTEGAMQGITAIEFAKKAGERWRALSEEEKEAYSQQHRDMQKYYAEELAQRQLENQKKRRRNGALRALENGQTALRDDSEDRSRIGSIDPNVKEERPPTPATNGKGGKRRGRMGRRAPSPAPGTPKEILIISDNESDTDLSRSDSPVPPSNTMGGKDPFNP